MMQKIVFIESNTTGTGKIFLTKAIEKGYEIVFLTEQSDRYPFLNELMVVPVAINTLNLNDILSYLTNIKDIKAVFSSSEYYIETAAIVAEILGLPKNNVQAIRDCRNKFILGQRLLSENIHTPQSYLVTTKEQAEAITNSIILPVVIKPSSGSGSVGVKLCRNTDEYNQHIETLLSKNSNERGLTFVPEVLVQEYVRGDEYSVEVIVDNNQQIHVIGITKKYLGEEPYFIEIGHDFPAPIDDILRDKIINTVKQAVIVMQLTMGAAHIELRVSDEKIYIIEINPRLAGGMIPALIELSTGIDVLDTLIDLYCGKAISLKYLTNNYSSIRFIIPEKEGYISKIDHCKNIEKMEGVKYFALTKKIGDKITILGDYRDRIGYIISVGTTIDESRSIVLDALSSISIRIDNDFNQSNSDTGRLKQSLHPDALAIVNQSISESSLHKELDYIVSVDEAHVIMLMETQIISLKTAKRILLEIQSIKKSDYSIFKNREVHRGIYLLYESILIENLGIDVGGVIHTGRSRNDMNATIFILKTREHYQKIYYALWSLRNIILNQIEKYSSVSMPVYSQFQPALPGNYAFYLLAIANALARDQEALKNSYTQMASSPLGAAAGCGTSFPIDSQRTAALLGFESNCHNALDAVASRDLAVRLLSSLSVLGMTLSRIAQDYQLWTTQEFAFFDLPDYLVGGSSMMPQKKNPYLLEKIKGKSIVPIGQLMTSLATMQKAPFSNSVEVGTEALVDFEKSFNSIGDAILLLQLIIRNARPIIKNMEASDHKGVTHALCVTEALTKTGMSFRASHHEVGSTIRKALETDSDPHQAIYQLLNDSQIKHGFETFKYGGGSSSASISHQYKYAMSQLENDGVWMQKIIAFWSKSNIFRDAAVKSILHSIE